MGRPKGSKNKRLFDVRQILQNNSTFLLEKALKLIRDDPEKNQALLLKLLDKIVPTTQINANIDISKKYEKDLSEIALKASQMLNGYQKGDKAIILLDEPQPQPAEFSEIKPVETLSQSEPIQGMPKESETLKTDLNVKSESIESPA